MKEKQSKIAKILSTSNWITTTIGVLLLFLLFGVPFIFMMIDNTALFWAVGIFVTTILIIGLQIWGIHALIKFIQNKAHLKYQINFFKLFLTVTISIILLLAVYALFTVEDAHISPFVKWFLPLVFIPAVINVAKGVVIKIEDKDDKEG